MKRVRADMRVVELGLAPSRNKAQALILAGVVLTEQGHRVDKAGEQLDPECVLRLKGQPLPYVSRGGLKLEGALDHFGVDATDRVCMDVGASHGGFTDCLLKRGARKVFCVDVGYGQLDWSLREDPRVVNLERVNIRTLEVDAVDETPELFVFDVSFISLHIVLPAALVFAGASAEVIALVKPQFEVGPERVGKGGIVRDPAARQDAVDRVVALLEKLGFAAPLAMNSPIQGAKGNHEYLVHGRRF